MNLWILTLALAIGPAQPPEGPTLELLMRIPPDALPAGCRLADSDKDRRSAGLFPGPNPWAGADGRRISLIHMRIAGMPPTPDGPPLDTAQTNRFMRHLADGIRQGYTASYVQPDGGPTTVDAVLFDDRDRARTSAETAATRPGSMIVHGGLLVASVRGAGTCAKAIATHLQSRLKAVTER